MSWYGVSDFDINKAVAECEGLFVALKQYPQNDVVVLNEDGADTKDYCNSWADIGPIISQERIGLNFIFDEWEAHNGEIDQGGTIICSIWYPHKNPLRAAAIVYLMSKGVSWEELK